MYNAEHALREAAGSALLWVRRSTGRKPLQCSACLRYTARL